MESNTYLPTVAWRTYARDVILLTEATSLNPATYRISVQPIDVNELGASTAEKQIGFYFKDYVGHTYTIIAYTATTIDVSDDFRCGVGAQSERQAIVYKSVGDGLSPYLAPIYYRHLDKSALEYSRQAELDILWKNESKLNISAIEDTKGLTGFVNPSDIDVYYDWANRTITLTGVLDYYWRGEFHTLSSPWTSSAHDNTVGKWFLQSVDGINFTWSETLWAFSDIQVSAVNYKSTSDESFAICETHGTMDWLSHEEDHQVNGTYLLSGGKATAGTYTLNTATDVATTPGFDQARLKDEDRETNVSAWIEGTYTTMYIGAVNTSVFNISSILPFISSGSYLQVNNVLTGSMTNGINNRYYNVYQILIPCTSDVNSQKFRTIFLQPQKTFELQEEAETETVNGLLFGELEALTPEFKVYSRITYVTAAGDSNTGKCRIASITYVLGTKGNPINVGGVVPTNHAALSNLPWINSAHTGTASSLAGFDVDGNADYTLKNTFAPASGSANYIQASPSLIQNASIWINGIIETSSYDGIKINRPSGDGTIFSSYKNSVRSFQLDDVGGEMWFYNQASGTYSFKVLNDGGVSFTGYSNAPVYKLNNVNLFGSLSSGAITKWNGTNFTSITNGTNGQILKIVDDAPVFADESGSGIDTTAMTANFIQKWDGTKFVDWVNPRPQTIPASTTAVWDVNQGIDANLTMTGDCYITLQNLKVSTSGTLHITKQSTNYRLKIKGYTLSISRNIEWDSTGILITGNNKEDSYTWSYNGEVLTINGNKDYNQTSF